MNRRDIALVTGGTGAIGRAIVEALIADGLEVHFTYRASEAEAHEIEYSLGAVSHRVDFSESWSPPDIDASVLVNAAGLNLSGRSLHNLDEDEVRVSFEVNASAAIQVSKHYARWMSASGFGRIVNINSLYGLKAPARRLSYAVSKFALRGATLAMAQDLAGEGITVNDVCPGPVMSRMLLSLADLAVEQGRFQSRSDYFEQVAANVPIGRFIKPEEVAAAVSFLASPAAGACTGMALLVDGGMHGS